MSLDCDHKWTPFQQWLGRYLCSKCKAIGHTDGKDFGYLEVKAKYSGNIIPYKCSKVDKKIKFICPNLATSILGDLALCEEHEPTMKISSAERRFHETIEKQNAKDKDMLDEAFKEMRAVTDQVLGRKKK